MDEAIRHFVNGIPAACVPIADRGLRYGDGCFETMSVQSGWIPLWHRHYKRLLDSCDRLQIKLDLNREALEGELKALIGETNDAVVRLTITRGSDTSGYQFDPGQAPTRISSLLPRKEYPHSFKEEGIKVCICETRLSSNPMLAGMKHLNRLEQVLARSEWNNEYAEGLLRDNSGDVIEGTISNLFIIEDGVLCTPELINCGVAGVMRAEILQHAQELGVKTREVAINQERLLSSDECFLSNAVIGIWPIKQINETVFTVGKLTQTLQKELMNIVINQA